MQRREFIQRALGGAVAVFARLYVPVVGSMVGQNPLSAWLNQQQNPLTRQFFEFPVGRAKDINWMTSPHVAPGRFIGYSTKNLARIAKWLEK